MGGPGPYSPQHHCAPGLVERDPRPHGDPGRSVRPWGRERTEPPQQRGLAEPAVGGQRCSPDPRPPRWDSRVKLCLSLSLSLSLSLTLSLSLSLGLCRPSKRSQPEMGDTKADFSPGMQPSSRLVLWQHLWVLPGPPWAPPRAEAQGEDTNMSCTGTGAKLSHSLPGESSLLQ